MPHTDARVEATPETRKEYEERYLGKLVRSRADYGTKIGIVERVCTQAEAWGSGSQFLVIMIRVPGAEELDSSWIKPDRIEVWGE